MHPFLPRLSPWTIVFHRDHPAASASPI